MSAAPPIYIIRYAWAFFLTKVILSILGVNVIVMPIYNRRTFTTPNLFQNRLIAYVILLTTT